MINLNPSVSFGSSKQSVSAVEYGAAKLIHRFANTGMMKRAADYASKDSSAVNISGKTIKNLDNVFKKHMPAILALWMSSFYVVNNLCSDIPKERKVPLLINDLLTASFSTIAGYTIVNGFKAFQFGLEEKLVKSMPLNDFIKGISKKAVTAGHSGKLVVKNLEDLLSLAKDKEFVKEVIKKLSEAIKLAPKDTEKYQIISTVADDIAKSSKGNEQVVRKFVKLVQAHTDKISTLKGGIGLMMSLFAFTFVFRYLGPVVATPSADKVNKFLIKHKIISDPKKKDNEPKQETNTSVSFDSNRSDYLKVLNAYFDSNKINRN